MSNHYIHNKTFELVIEAFQASKRRKVRHEMMLQDLKETHDRRLKKHKEDTKSKLLMEKEAEYVEICELYKVHQEKLAFDFYRLSENLANYTRYQGIDVDDAIQEGVLICFEKIDRFDSRRGKAFNYMTTCIINHYRQQYRSVKNYNELKKRYGIFLQDKMETFLRTRVGPGRGDFESNDNSDSGN